MEEKQKKTPGTWHEKKSKIKIKLFTPFIFIEWIAEWILYSLMNSALFGLLGFSGRFVLIVTFILAAVTFFTEKDKREIERENIRKQKHYQAWQVINLAEGKGGEGGRLDALSELAKDNVPLNGIDLSFANLSGLDVSGASLVNAKFIESLLDSSNFQNCNISSSDLQRAKMHGSLLDSVSFINSDLRKAELKGSSIRGGNFSDAKLDSIDLTNTILFGANFKGADLSNAKLEGATLFKTIFYDANLKGAILNELDFSGSGLLVEFEPKIGGRMGLSQSYGDAPRKVMLEDAKLKETNFDSLFLVRANFRSALLIQARFIHTNLTNADFESAYLGGADFSHANLSAVNLSGTSGGKVNFESSNLGPGPARAQVFHHYEWALEPANLTGAHFEESNFRGANLREAILISAQLGGSQFEDADLSGAVLSNANLRGVNLLNANLRQADLRKSDLFGIENWKSIKDISLCNIYGVKFAPDGFADWALQHGAVDIQSDEEWEKVKAENK